MMKSDQAPPALVLGVDTAIGLTVIRELGQHGVAVFAIGKDAGSVGRHCRYTKGFYVRPRDRPLAEWLPAIIADCGARVLLAVGEIDLLALADLPRNLNGCTIASPRHDKLAIVLDKGRTLSAAREVGIDVPTCWQPLVGEDFAEKARTFPYPAIVKWSDPPAIRERLDLAGLSLEKVEHAGSADALLAILSRYGGLGVYPLVQSWCAGEGFGQMLYMASGKATLMFQHRRLREFPPSGGVSTLCESVPLEQHREQMAKSQDLLAHIGWEGPAMVEYRYDATASRYWLMEINGRFWGSLPLANQSGAHFAWEHYRRTIDAGAPLLSNGYRYRRARHLVPDTKRFLQVMRCPSRVAAPGEAPPARGRELLSYLGEFFNPSTGYYVSSLSDPKPALADMLGMIKKRVRR